MILGIIFFIFINFDCWILFNKIVNGFDFFSFSIFVCTVIYVQYIKFQW